MIRRDVCLLVALAVGGLLLVWLTRPLPESAYETGTVSVPEGSRPSEPSTPLLVPADKSLLLGRTAEATSPGDAWDKALQTVAASLAAVEAWLPGRGDDAAVVLRGCGVFVGSQGELLLPYVLVAEGRALRVQMADGTARAVRVAAVDRFSGLALARVSGVASVPVRWAAEAPRLQRVVVVAIRWGVQDALGFGLLVVPRHSGVVEDLAGVPELLRVTSTGLEEIPGAALVNGQGEVAGLVRAPAVREPVQRDLAVIPAGMARASAQAMMQGTVLRRPYLGVAVQPVDRDLAAVLGLAEAKGALVSDLTPEGPGAQAGLQPGDVIVKIGDFSVSSHQELRALVGRLPAEQPMRLEVWRRGALQTVEVAAATRDPNEVLPRPPPTVPPGESVLRSLEVRAAGGALVVASFKAHEVVASERLAPGDRILEVDGVAVATPEDFAAAREKTKTADAVLLRVDDGGMRRYLVLKRP